VLVLSEYIVILGTCGAMQNKGYYMRQVKLLLSFLLLSLSLNAFASTSDIVIQTTHKPIPSHVWLLVQKAYFKAKTSGTATKPFVTVIDYSLPSTERRLWVVDIEQKKVLYNTHVAHGSGSGSNAAKFFSDKPGSRKTCLGVFKTGKTYQGKHGISLELHGLEKGINGNALRRRVVMHGANYVNESFIKIHGRLGRSWGCPALEMRVVRPIIQTIKEGSLVFSYYPDKHWMSNSRFIS